MQTYWFAYFEVNIIKLNEQQLKKSMLIAEIRLNEHTLDSMFLFQYGFTPSHKYFHIY